MVGDVEEGGGGARGLGEGGGREWGAVSPSGSGSIDRRCSFSSAKIMRWPWHGAGTNPLPPAPAQMGRALI